MHPLRWLSILGICWLLTHCLSAQGAAAEDEPESELATRTRIMEDVSRALLAQDFEHLETLAARLRKTNARTPSGQSQLAMFYDGLNLKYPNFSMGCAGGYGDLIQLTRNWMIRFPTSSTAVIARAYMGAQMVRRRCSDASEYQTHWLAHELDDARAGLLEVKTAAASDPNWFRVRILFAVLDDEPESVRDALLAESVARAAWFFDAHYAVLDGLTAHLDDPALVTKLERFVRATVRRTRATEGQSLYARLYWYYASAFAGDGLFVWSEASWPLMRTGFEDLLSRYPGAWNTSAFARFACMARDRASTATQFDRLGNAVDTGVWPWEYQAVECYQWSSPARPDAPRI